MTCTCACHESEEWHSPDDCYCMNDKLQDSFERFIDENTLEDSRKEEGEA